MCRIEIRNENSTDVITLEQQSQADVDDFFDEDEFEIPTGINGRDILSYITPSLLMVETHPNTDGIAFHVECGCDWEAEHGLEITISGKRILYVGPYEGISPYNQARLESIGFYDEESDFSGNFADQE